MGAQGLAFLLEVSSRPYARHVLHTSAAGAAAAVAAAAELLPRSHVRCEVPSRGWYAGVPEPFPAPAFEGDEGDRSFIFDKEYHDSGTVVSTIADGIGGLSYVKVPPTMGRTAHPGFEGFIF